MTDRAKTAAAAEKRKNQRNKRGKHVAYVPPALPPITTSVDEACAQVDAWSNEQQFGVHMIARCLRSEIARLQMMLGDG